MLTTALSNQETGDSAIKTQSIDLMIKKELHIKLHIKGVKRKIYMGLYTFKDKPINKVKAIKTLTYKGR